MFLRRIGPTILRLTVVLLADCFITYHVWPLALFALRHKSQPFCLRGIDGYIHSLLVASLMRVLSDYVSAEYLAVLDTA